MPDRVAVTPALGFAIAIALAGATAFRPAAAFGQGDAPALSPADFEEAKGLYFQRCAGCHGVLRKGATGKNLEPENTRKLGQKRLERIIALGTDGGMNNFDDVFTPEEIRKLAAYVQLPPPTPPEMDLAEMKRRWKVHVPPAERPTRPEHGRNWENFFIVILREPGKVAVIDGDTKEVVAKVNTGYAVHVAKSSSDGRFWYTMGRDGKMTMIDLWSEPPQVVAKAQIAFDARDVAVSLFGAWKDRYVVGGAYWPPHFVVLDAATLEPLKAVSTRGVGVDGRYHDESRVAAVYASRHNPTWVLAVKELGQFWQVDYSDLANLRVDMVDAKRFLHDGFFTPDGAYFQAAANASDSMEFLDVRRRKAAGSLATGKKPSPGPGANWVDETCGPVGATVHLGEGRLAVWGNDPQGRPDMAWKLCYAVALDGPGLFLRTHPNSPYVFMDQAMHPDPVVASSIKVLDKRSRQIVRTIRVTEQPRATAVHIEFNNTGGEAWVSVWAKGGKADWAKGEVVVYDARTLVEKARIRGLETPTGKFNVGNRRAGTG